MRGGICPPLKNCWILQARSIGARREQRNFLSARASPVWEEGQSDSIPACCAAVRSIMKRLMRAVRGVIGTIRTTSTGTTVFAWWLLTSFVRQKGVPEIRGVAHDRFRVAARKTARSVPGRAGLSRRANIKSPRRQGSSSRRGTLCPSIGNGRQKKEHGDKECSWLLRVSL